MTISKRKINKIIINHTLPIIGKKEISLYGETANIYRFLEKKGVVLSLKNQNQLGIIANVVNTAHHPKYEYVFFLMSLIDSIKEQLRGEYPLRRNVYRKMTGLELLKSWALLLSVGHLPCTFPVEKAVLRILHENKAVFNKFVGFFKERHQKYVKKIIFDQNVYSFYHVLALYKLKKYCYKNKRQEHTGFLSMLMLYSKPKNRTMRALKSLFSELRQVAYVVLDAYYSSQRDLFSPHDFDQIGERIKNKQFMGLIKSANSLLESEIYKCGESCVAETLLYQAIYDKIKYHEKPYDIIQNLIFMDDDKDIVREYSKYKLENKLDDKKYVEMFNISTEKEKILTQENQLKTSLDRFFPVKFNRLKSVLFYVDNKPGSENNEIRYFLNQNYRIKNSKLLGRLIIKILEKSLSKEKRNISNYKNLPIDLLMYIKRNNSENSLNSILSFVLKTVFHVKIDKYLFSEKVAGIPMTFLVENIEIMNELVKYIKNKFNINKNTLNELEEIYAMLKNIWKSGNEYIVHIGNITLYKKNKSVNEIDGIILETDAKNNVNMYIIEAKKHTRSYSESKKQLLKIKRRIVVSLKEKRRTNISRISEISKSGYLKISL